MGSKFRRRDRTGRSSTRGRNPPTLEWRTTASSSLHLLEWVLFFQCEIQYTFDVLLDSCFWFLSDSLLSYYGIWCDIKVLWTSSRTKCSSTEETSVWSYRTSLTSWSRSTQWLPSYSSTTSSTTKKKWGRLNVRQLLLVRGYIKDLWSFIGNNEA